MNKRVLGEQLYGHLKLYRDLGVRYVEKARPVQAAARPTEAPDAGAPNAGVVAAARSAMLPPAELPAAAPAETLEVIRADMGDCRRCKLAPTRTHIVFGAGNPRAALMFIGEAPGADEDAQGLPFVGRAGQLLTKIIQAIGLRREDVFICNILKCRPPENRNPETDEIAACENFLFRQIAAVNPQIIVALGAFGAQTLLRTTETIGKLRGRLIDYRGIKLMATYHPAYLLRSPMEKRKVWEDMQRVRDFMRALRVPEKN